MSDPVGRIGSGQAGNAAPIAQDAALQPAGAQPASKPASDRAKKMVSGVLSGLANIGGRADKKIAAKVYNENRLYHGTLESNTESLRRDGFDASRKTPGAANGVGPSGMGGAAGEAAANHNYLTSDANLAKAYSGQASMAHFWSHLDQTMMDVDGYEKPTPALVRVLGVRNNPAIALESDPDTPPQESGAHEVSFRTRNNIPPEHVLGSKHSPPGADAAVFQGLLADAGLKVDQNKAGTLLRRVQSSDELDFKNMDATP